jgi:hypothetical protein
MRPLAKRKLVAALASAAGAAALALSSLTASAAAAPNPENPYGAQSTNVPYVAWVGEHVRVVACSEELTEDLHTAVTGQSIDNFYEFFNANFAVEDWSGYQFQPPTPDGEAASELGQYFDPGPAAFFLSSEGRVCIATDYKSLNPGLTRIRAVVKSDSTGEIVFSHQFLVIWLTANKPVLHEAGLEASGTEVFQNQLSPTGKGNLARMLGDPSGNGEFAPSPFSGGAEEDEGLIQIKVSGSFPVIAGTPLSNLLPEPSYTLPADWTTLAETLSSSQEETEPPGTNPMLWDIHGTPAEDPWHSNSNEYEESEVGSGACETGSPSSQSSTDNCNGGTTVFSREFSSPFALTSGLNATVGPYDPQAGDETLLSDGRLNASDAPMPAMRIDVSIAKNTGGSDLGGVGQISGASKATIYSHDFNGAPTPHNLYNPYYSAYIPATDRGEPQSSGVTGSSPGGDFPGFLNAHPEPYVFWNSVLSTNDRFSHPTGCLRREGADPEEYETPSGPLTETFYTDEEGEAYVTYTPGDGFYLENLPELKEGEAEAPGEIIKNNDGGCDLKLLYGQEIGKSSITAKAVYPYEPVDYPAQTSEAPLVKTVKSLWEKEWFQFPKGPGSDEQNIRIIVAKAQDIDGKPLAGEVVCFHAEEGSGVIAFTGAVTDNGAAEGQTELVPGEGLLGFGKGARISLSGTEVVHPIGREGLCERSNSQGLAGIEVENSSSGKVDLTVTYTEEGIVRDHFIDFASNAGGIAEKEAEEKAAKEAAEKEAKEKAEKEAKEKAEKEAKEKAEKEAKEKEETKGTVTLPPSGSKAATTSTTTTPPATSAPLVTPAPTAGSSDPPSSGGASKPSTRHAAKCEKLPKGKRAACAGTKGKKHKKKKKMKK